MSISLLHRVRWGNVARLVSVVAVIGIVVAQPYLGSTDPQVPDDTVSLDADPIRETAVVPRSAAIAPGRKSSTNKPAKRARPRSTVPQRTPRDEMFARGEHFVPGEATTATAHPRAHSTSSPPSPPTSPAREFRP